jgi:hypothetical protein
MQIQLPNPELDIIYAAAGPLDADVRDAFIQAVVRELSLLGDLGPGIIFRIARTAQRQFFTPPNYIHERGPSTSRRRYK